jgi:hypothetical protein
LGFQHIDALDPSQGMLDRAEAKNLYERYICDFITDTKGQYKIDNPEKLATWGIQDEEKQIKNTTQYVLDTTICKQTHIT